MSDQRRRDFYSLNVFWVPGKGQAEISCESKPSENLEAAHLLPVSEEIGKGQAGNVVEIERINRAAGEKRYPLRLRQGFEEDSVDYREDHRRAADSGCERDHG